MLISKPLQQTLLNFCLCNPIDFCELVDFPLQFSTFALYISNLCHCAHIESCFLIDSTFYPYEYISVIFFVPFKAEGGSFQSEGSCLQHWNLKKKIIIIILFHCVCLLELFLDKCWPRSILSSLNISFKLSYSLFVLCLIKLLSFVFQHTQSPFFLISFCHVVYLFKNVSKIKTFKISSCFFFMGEISS